MSHEKKPEDHDRDKHHEHHEHHKHHEKHEHHQHSVPPEPPVTRPNPGSGAPKPPGHRPVG